MDKELNRTYVAMKPKGFSYYIWFETEKVLIAQGCIIAREGWGKSGAYTNIKCREEEIESYIYSDELQYS